MVYKSKNPISYILYPIGGFILPLPPPPGADSGSQGMTFAWQAKKSTKKPMVFIAKLHLADFEGESDDLKSFKSSDSPL